MHGSEDKVLTTRRRRSRRECICSHDHKRVRQAEDGRWQECKVKRQRVREAGDGASVPCSRRDF